MKKFIYICFLLISFGMIYAQQASDYFPETCARWEYKVTVLDSLSNEIDSLHYYRHDLFFEETNFEGKPAKILQTKSGPAETIYFQPYLDSLFLNFEGSNGNEYFKLGLIEHLIGFVDSLITDTTFSVLNFFQSLESWYSVYRFAQYLGDEYTILQIDTTVTIDTLTLPLRLEIIGKRLPDEVLSTQIGDLNCKKFVRTIRLSYLIMLPPPIPPIAFPILSLGDSIWIAEDYWIVQGIIPPLNIDLSIINIPPVFIPGLITKLDAFFLTPCTSVDDGKVYSPEEITLEQNYPNPFNPRTIIKFSLSSPGFATLKIYNTIGEEVALLLNKELATGTYEVEWNAGNLPSGVYFYRVQTEGYIETKKMLLLK